MENYAILDDSLNIINIFVGFDKNEKIDGVDPETWYTNHNGKVCVSISDKNGFAEIGGTYDLDKKIFISNRPFPSWIFNYSSYLWEAPNEKPDGSYYWDEASTSWKEDTGSDIM